MSQSYVSKKHVPSHESCLVSLFVCLISWN